MIKRLIEKLKTLRLYFVINSVCPKCDDHMIEHINETKIISGKEVKTSHSVQKYCNECGYVSLPKHCL